MYLQTPVASVAAYEFAGFAASLVIFFFRDVPSSSYACICLTFASAFAGLSASRSDSHAVASVFTKTCGGRKSYGLIGVRQHQPARRSSRRTVPLRLTLGRLGFPWFNFAWQASSARAGVLLVRRTRRSSARAGIPFSDVPAETHHDPIRDFSHLVSTRFAYDDSLSTSAGRG